MKKVFQALAMAALLVAALTVFVASPAAMAAPHQVHHTAVSAKHAIPNDPWCQYRVTATAGLNVREGPGLGYAVRYVLAYGTIVVADASTIYNNGYYWHNIADNYNNDYAVGNWLVRTGGSCVMQLNQRGTYTPNTGSANPHTIFPGFVCLSYF